MSNTSQAAREVIAEAIQPAIRRSAEELAMREIVVTRLRREYPDARIIHELPLRYSTRRIDLAAVTLDAIISVEIKSSRDVIDRLEAQLRGFIPVSKRLIVALAPRWNAELPSKQIQREINGRSYTSYLAQHTEAQAIIAGIGAPNIETWTVDAENGAITAESGSGYMMVVPWFAQMLHILHRSELANIAARHLLDVGRRPTHRTLVEQAAYFLSGRDIAREVCAALRRRNAFDAASDAPILSHLNRSDDDDKQP